MTASRDKGRRTTGDQTIVHRDAETRADPTKTAELGFEPTVVVGPETGRSGHMAGMASSSDLPSADRFSDPTKLVEQHVVPRGEATMVVSSSTSSSASPMDDPPAGWLVVVEGPGRGHVGTIGIGQNAVGRDEESNRISIDNGDRMLSRTKHIVVVYDPTTRRFYVQPGDGTNLAYMDDEPVLAARELLAGTHLRLGRTVLRFVPLCGDDFHWPTQ